MTSPETEHDAFDGNTADTADSAVELSPPRPEVLERLVQSHREFLAFLRPRVPSDAVAEEILCGHEFIEGPEPVGIWSVLDRPAARGLFEQAYNRPPCELR